MSGVCNVLLVCEQNSIFPCKSHLCCQRHYSQSTLLLTEKIYCNLVLQEHPNSGTFAGNALQRIIHLCIIIHLKHKQTAKHDRNESHVKETKGIHSVGSNTIRSEPKEHRVTYLCSKYKLNSDNFTDLHSKGCGLDSGEPLKTVLAYETYIKMLP